MTDFNLRKPDDQTDHPVIAKRRGPASVPRRPANDNPRPQRRRYRWGLPAALLGWALIFKMFMDWAS